MKKSNLGGIDYSKWDNFGDSDSDSECDSDYENRPGPPRVTRLEKPGSVTWSPDGSIILNPTPTPASTPATRPATRAGPTPSSTIAPTPAPTPTTAPTSTSTSTTTTTPTSTSPKADKSFDVEDTAGTQKELNKLSSNGDFFLDPITNHPIFWSQTRSEVIISIPFDPNTFPSKAICVEVLPSTSDIRNPQLLSHLQHPANPILPYSNRHSAVSGSDDDPYAADKGRLCVYAHTNSSNIGTSTSTSTNEYTFFSGRLPHFIHGTEEEEKEKQNNTVAGISISKVDWEIVNDTSKYGSSALLSRISKDRTFIKPTTNQGQQQQQQPKMIQITLRKAVPMYGVYIWWNKPLHHCPEIDVSTISDRKHSKNHTSHETHSQNKSESNIQSVWEEAHAMFQEKIKRNQKSISPSDIHKF